MVLTEESLIDLLELWVCSKGNKSEQELQEIARLSIDTRPLEKQFIEKIFDFWCYSQQENKITDAEWSDIKNQMYLLISKGFKQKPLHEIVMQIFQRDLFILDVKNNRSVFNHAHHRHKQNLFILDFLRSMNQEKTLILDADRTILPHNDDIDPSDNKDGKIPYYPWVSELIAKHAELANLGIKKIIVFTAASESSHKSTYQDLESQFKIQMEKDGVPLDTFQFEFYSRSHTYEIYELKEDKRAITVTTKLSDKTKQTISYDRSAKLNLDGTVNIAESTPTGITVATTSSDGRTVTTTSYDGLVSTDAIMGLPNTTGATATGTTVATTSSDGGTVTTTSYNGLVSTDAITGLPNTTSATATRKTKSKRFRYGSKAQIDTYDIKSGKQIFISTTVSETLDNGFVQNKTFHPTSENHPTTEKLKLIDTTIEKTSINEGQKMIKYHDIRPIKIITAPDGSVVVDDLLHNILTLNKGISKIQSGVYDEYGNFNLNQNLIDKIRAALTNKECTSLGTTDPGSGDSSFKTASYASSIAHV